MNTKLIENRFYSNLESNTFEKKALEAWEELQRLRDDPVAALQISNGKLIMELHKIIYESSCPSHQFFPIQKIKNKNYPIGRFLIKN